MGKGTVGEVKVVEGLDLFLSRTLPVLRWGVSGWVRCDVDWVHKIAALVPDYYQ